MDNLFEKQLNSTNVLSLATVSIADTITAYPKKPKASRITANPIIIPIFFFIPVSVLNLKYSLHSAQS